MLANPVELANAIFDYLEIWYNLSAAPPSTCSPRRREAIFTDHM
ncbi:MAG: hypothetical protein ACT4O0_13400 [Pseudonocardia sp.]|jgi:hypothetical protein